MDGQTQDATPQVAAEAQIQTGRPGRYLVQLCRHARQMTQHRGHRRHIHSEDGASPEVQHVEWSDTEGIVRLNWGQWTIRATTDTLTVRAEAVNEDALRRIQDLVTGRLEQFGRREHLTVAWHRPQSSNGAHPAESRRT